MWIYNYYLMIKDKRCSSKLRIVLSLVMLLVEVQHLTMTIILHIPEFDKLVRINQRMLFEVTIQ